MYIIMPIGKMTWSGINHSSLSYNISAVGKRVGLGNFVQVEGSILTAGKRLSLKNLNVIIRAIN